MTVSSQVLDGVNMIFIAFHIPFPRCQKISRWAFLLIVLIASDFLPDFDSFVMTYCCSSFIFILDLTQTVTTSFSPISLIADFPNHGQLYTLGLQ